MPVMSAPSGNPLQELARTLFSGLEGHADEPIIPDQFTTFLSRLAASATPTTTTAAGRVTASTFSLPSTTTSPTMSVGPRSPMEGFDFGTIASGDLSSPKYRFARVAWRYDLSEVSDEAGAEAMLKTMVPDLDAAGLTVVAVRGSRLTVRGDQRDCCVDVIRWNPLGGVPSFQWAECQVS